MVDVQGEDDGRSAPPDLAGRLSGIARTLQRQGDVGSTVTAVVAAAVDLLPGADAGSFCVVVGGRQVDSHAASDLLAEQVDAVQEEVGEGPCLQAVSEQRTVRIPDMAGESRWPRFAPRAAGLGAGSMLCLQLFVGRETLGALSVLSRVPGAFDADSEQAGLLLADHAAVALAGAREAASLLAMSRTRDLIGQAKGILMERHRVGSDEAFGMLTRASQLSHRKLRDVADELCLTGRLPPPG